MMLKHGKSEGKEKVFSCQILIENSIHLGTWLVFMGLFQLS